MLEDIHKIANWPFEMPLEETLRRLGGHLSDSAQTSSVLPILRKVYHLCQPRGMYGELSVKAWDDQHVLLTDDTDLRSPALAKFLSGASCVWLAVTTIGSDASSLSHDYLEKKDGASALIADAAASECVEMAFNAMQTMAVREYLRGGRTLDQWRFSCGYGGWNLTDQARYFRWFPMSEIGVALTDACIMQPEKTITAIGRID